MARGIFNGAYRVRFGILQRDNFTCQYCGRSAPDVILHVDHKIAVVDGGTDEDENLITACSACNIGKEHLRYSVAEKTKKRRPAPTQMRILNFVKDNECVGYMEISEKLGMPKTLVGKNLTKLKEKGLVYNKDFKWFVVKAEVKC